MDGGEQVQSQREVDSPIKVELPPRNDDEPTGAYLMRLEATKNYLFHGSPVAGIAELEPRLSTDVGGDPRVHNVFAVFATEKAALASQRAILPVRDSITGEWSVSAGTNPKKMDEPLLTVSENITLSTGVVYVLPRDGFEYIEGWGQWKKMEPVTPLGEIKVVVADYVEMGGKIEKSTMDQRERLFQEIKRVGLERNVEEGFEFYDVRNPQTFLEWACVNGFVFHGSARRIAGDLLPSQANDEAKESGNRNAVYMTKTPPLVMFTALAGGRDVGVRRNKVFLEITGEGEVKYPKPPEFGVGRPEEVADEGYVYIFDEKSQVAEKVNGEYLSYEPIKPLAVIRIKKTDFGFPIVKIEI